MTKSNSSSDISPPPLRGGGGGGDGAQPNNNANNKSSKLTQIRRTLFPLYTKHEVTKFLLLGSINFFIIMVLTLTRDTKDTLVVTQCGAEAIAFLKIYGVLPAATAFIALYSKMASVLDRRSLFYTTCIPFFIFFIVFDTIIYPNRNTIQPSLDTIHSAMGITTDAESASGFKDILARIISNWTSVLFYIISEIYSSVSVGLLFWQYANDVVTINEAKRFYPLFAQMSGLAPVFAGQYMARYMSKADSVGESLRRLTIMVTFGGVMICLFYHWSNSYIEQTESMTSSDSTSTKKTKKKKPKLSMLESAKFLASSEYLRLIATLVLGYGLSINFTEIMWKSLVKKRYPDPLDYQRFMGNFSSAVGMSTVIVIFFGVHVIRILGWRIGALATPVTMSILALPFFTCILMGLDSPTRLQAAVLIGMVQNLLSKSFKYALFDPSTQMSYIPLDDESKVKGKAAIDVLGSRIGKSGGSLIQQGLVIVYGNIIAAAPALVILFYGVMGGWMNAADRLSYLFAEKTEEAAAATAGKKSKDQKKDI